jgi:hypothetical protein
MSDSDYDYDSDSDSGYDCDYEPEPTPPTRKRLCESSYARLPRDKKKAYTAFMKRKKKMEETHASMVSAGKLPYTDMHDPTYFTDMKIEEIDFMRLYLTEVRAYVSKKEHLINLGVLQPDPAKELPKEPTIREQLMKIINTPGSANVVAELLEEFR